MLRPHLLVEVANCLRLAVDLKDEIVLRKILNEGSFFVADDDGEVDEAGIDSDGGGGGGWALVRSGGLLLREEARRKKNAGQKERPERAEDDHMVLDDIRWRGFQSGLSWRVVLPTYQRGLHRLLLQSLPAQRKA